MIDYSSTDHLLIGQSRLIIDYASIDHLLISQSLQLLSLIMKYHTVRYTVIFTTRNMIIFIPCKYGNKLWKMTGK